MMKRALCVAILLLAVPAWGQFKIGELTIPEKYVGPYFSDLYLHPDTVWNGVPIFYGHQATPVNAIKYIEIYSMQDSVGPFLDTTRWGIYGYWTVPRQATQEDFIEWCRKQKLSEAYGRKEE